MYQISEQQIDFILEDFQDRGIQMESLRYELLDHICILIEQGLKEGEDFHDFYKSVLPSFYRQELKEIEKETTFLLSLRHHWVLSRNQFFLLLFTVFIGPYIGYDLMWMISTNRPAGDFLPMEILAGTFVFALFPLLILCVLYFTPDRLDPIIPKRSRILLGVRPFIKVIPPSETPAHSATGITFS